MRRGKWDFFFGDVRDCNRRWFVAIAALWCAGVLSLLVPVDSLAQSTGTGALRSLSAGIPTVLKGTNGFLEGEIGQRVSYTVTVTNHSENPFVLTDVRASEEHYTETPEESKLTIPPGQSAPVTIAYEDTSFRGKQLHVVLEPHILGYFILPDHSKIPYALDLPPVAVEHEAVAQVTCLEVEGNSRFRTHLPREFVFTRISGQPRVRKKFSCKNDTAVPVVLSIKLNSTDSSIFSLQETEKKEAGGSVAPISGRSLPVDDMISFEVVYDGGNTPAEHTGAISIDVATQQPGLPSRTYQFALALRGVVVNLDWQHVQQGQSYLLAKISPEASLGFGAIPNNVAVASDGGVLHLGKQFVHEDSKGVWFVNNAVPGAFNARSSASALFQIGAILGGEGWCVASEKRTFLFSLPSGGGYRFLDGGYHQDWTPTSLDDCISGTMFAVVPEKPSATWSGTPSFAVEARLADGPVKKRMAAQLEQTRIPVDVKQLPTLRWGPLHRGEEIRVDWAHLDPSMVMEKTATVAQSRQDVQDFLRDIKKGPFRVVWDVDLPLQVVPSSLAEAPPGWDGTWRIRVPQQLGDALPEHKKRNVFVVVGDPSKPSRVYLLEVDMEWVHDISMPAVDLGELYPGQEGKFSLRLPEGSSWVPTGHVNCSPRDRMTADLERWADEGLLVNGVSSPAQWGFSIPWYAKPGSLSLGLCSQGVFARGAERHEGQVASWPLTGHVTRKKNWTVGVAMLHGVLLHEGSDEKMYVWRNRALVAYQLEMGHYLVPGTLVAMYTGFGIEFSYLSAPELGALGVVTQMGLMAYPGSQRFWSVGVLLDFGIGGRSALRKETLSSLQSKLYGSLKLDYNFGLEWVAQFHLGTHWKRAQGWFLQGIFRAGLWAPVLGHTGFIAANQAASEIGNPVDFSFGLGFFYRFGFAGSSSAKGAL